MMWRTGEVIAEKNTWGTCTEYIVRLEDGREVKGLAYHEQVGHMRLGDHVIMTGSAFEKGLGTGGTMMIVANPKNLPADPPPQAGHIIKARYTPMQIMVQGVDEQESPHHALMREADSINGMPVVIADLHSALPAIVAGIRTVNPQARIAYIMTDGGALPAWFSQTVFTLHKTGHILGTITCGQAFGGELEAINVHTALLAAKLVWNADVAVVAQGPGNAGTGTAWGFSGVASAQDFHAAYTLHGRPIACLRLSQTDQRERHYGVSHHTLRVLRDAVFVPVDLAIPMFDDDARYLPSGFTQRIDDQLSDILNNPHHPVFIPTAGLYEALEASPVKLRTMGRSLDEDTASFIAAAAAGAYAAKHV